MGSLAVWGEGVAGTIHLEIQSVKATGCNGMHEGREDRPDNATIGVQKPDMATYTETYHANDMGRKHWWEKWWALVLLVVVGMLGCTGAALPVPNSESHCPHP